MALVIQRSFCIWYKVTIILLINVWGLFSPNFGFFFFPQDEIFDMVKPKDPYKISLQDLINSSQGDTVTSILIDLNGFWTYENREVLVASDNDSTADVDDT